MKSLIALILLVFSTTASAELYKYVDPVTGAVEYTRTAKKGAVVLSAAPLATLNEDQERPYRCDEPGNRQPIYKKWPELGCVVMESGELLDTDDALMLEKTKRLAIQRTINAANAARLKRIRAAYAALAKTHPKACSREEGELVCLPTPGMSIRSLVEAMELDSPRYTLTESGRTDMYKYETCRIFARGGKVTMVQC